VGFFVIARKPTFLWINRHMDNQNITLAIKGISRQFGFVDAGIIRPQKSNHIGTFLSWISDGHAAGMTYLKLEKGVAARENPLLLFPECQSIIVLLARYPAPDSSNAWIASAGHGRIAAYAGGEDYHAILIEKLGGLADKLAELNQCKVLSRAFTDSGPLLEREMAFNAGLGWIGRNTCLISPEHGSYTFLAELLTDLPLEPQSTLIGDHCGNCHRCVDACPTHCILPDRTIAAERCLSYLTIENRGEIPRDWRHLLEDRVFGCDICQEVCPWNRKVENSCVDERFLATDRIKKLDLINELRIKEAEFSAIYFNSPIKRAKRRGYLRNIALAIGNCPFPEARDVLLTVIREEGEPLIRAAAVWAVASMIDERVRGELIARLEVEREASVRKELLHVLDTGV
jgi:epoxyqueuosine reductase